MEEVEEDVVSLVGRTATAAPRAGSLASPSMAGHQRHLRQRGKINGLISEKECWTGSDGAFEFHTSGAEKGRT